MPETFHLRKSLKTCLFYSQDPYLLKSGMSQNNPKPAKTNQNQPKQPETSQSDPKKIVKQPKTNQIFKIGDIRNFLLALVFKTSSPNPQIWVFGSRSINFSIFHVACTLFRRLRFQIWHCFLKLRAQISKYWHFGSKCINFLNLTKFCLYPITKVLIFGFDLTLVFENFEPKCWNLAILDQKSKLFLISAKFQIYPISKVLISKSDTCLKILHPDPQMRVFWVKSVNFLILREFCMYAISLFRCWRQSWYS